MRYEIINERKKALGLTNAMIANMTGITLSTLDKITSGANQNPKLDTIQKIADVIGCTLDDFTDNQRLSAEAISVATDYDILDTHGKRAVRAVLDVEKKRVNEEFVETTPMIKLLHFEHPAAAGEPLDANSDSEYVSYYADEVPEGADFTVKLSGHSMEPDYPDQSIVFIHRTYDISDGDVVIAWLDGNGMTCKRAVMDGDKVVRLESINRNEVDFEGEELVNMRIYGKVIDG